MARVISNLPNHSECVNGIKFTADRGEMISEEIPDETAAVLATIKGYRIAGKGKGKGKVAAEGAETQTEGDGADGGNGGADNGAAKE